MAPELISCKHCGFKFRIDVKELVDEGKTNFVRGIVDFWKKKPTSAEYIDIQCPKCSKWFEHKVQ